MRHILIAGMSRKFGQFPAIKLSESRVLDWLLHVVRDILYVIRKFILKFFFAQNSIAILVVFNFTSIKLRMSKKIEFNRILAGISIYNI